MGRPHPDGNVILVTLCDQCGRNEDQLAEIQHTPSAPARPRVASPPPLARMRFAASLRRASGRTVSEAGSSR